MHRARLLRLASFSLALLSAAGCEGTLAMSELAADAALPPADAGAAPMPTPTPGTDAAPPADDAASPMPMPIEPDAGTPQGALAVDLAIAQVDLYQTVRVPLATQGSAADRDELPVVAGRDTLVRVHAEPLAGWRSREVSAVLELEQDGVPRRFVDTRAPMLPARDDVPESVFAIIVPGDALTPGVRFRVRLEEPSAPGAADADAPDAQYPALGAWADLGVVDTGTVTVVLVPFRYETDGSGRLPDTSAMQLTRIEDELTSRFPYARIDLRVHDVVAWSRSTRIGGNVDWGAVNARLISMRDGEGAHPAEYWYGLVAPNTSRSAYCDDVYGSCVTGQAYVATLRGSRVGSGVGFGDVASVRTLAHELGHEHGRYHTPCGTSGTDEDYPHHGGLIGTWGWDRRTGDFHAPDVGTDMMGYCSRQWVSDYTYRAMYDRQMALRAASWSLVGAPVARRFVTVEDGVASWGAPTELRTLPGERARGEYVDAAGSVIAADVEIGALEVAHGDEHVWVVPAAAPAGAVALLVGGDRLTLP